MVTPTGEADGFSIDLMKAVCRVMGLQPEFRVGPWKEVRDALEKGEVDALPLVSYSEERERVFDFTLPHTKAYATVFVRDGGPRIATTDDLRGREIVVMRGDATHDFLVREGLADRAMLVATIPDALRSVASGRHELTLVPRLVALIEARRLGLTNIRPIGPLIDVHGRGYGFAVREGNHGLLQTLNEGLAIVKQTGEYDRIYQKWFGIVDPPGIAREEIERALLIAGGVAGGLVLLVLLWIVTLRRLVARRTAELETEIAAHLRAEEELRRRTHDLGERVKELTTYYGVAEILRSTEATLDEVLQSIVDLLPGGWHFPNVTRARILYRDREFKSAGFEETEWRQSVPIRIEGVRIGLLEVVLREFRPEFGATSFLDEERSLLETIAVHVGDYIRRREAEAALQASERKLSQILDTMPVALCLVDEAGAIYFRNRRFLQHFGYSRDRVPTLSEWWSLAYPDPAYRDWVLATWNEAVRRAAAEGRDIEPMEYRVTCGDGRILDMEISGITFGTDFLATFLDHTERKAAEAALRRKNLDIERAYAELEAIANVSSHDLREPLRNLSTYATILVRRLGERLEGDDRESLEIIHSAALRVNDLIRDLRDFTRVGQSGGTMEWVDSGSCVAAALQVVQPRLGGAGGEVQVASGLPTVLANREELERVFRNLLENAVTFRGSDRPLRIAVGCAGQDGQWRFSVADNGIGIEPGSGYEERIFGLFERLHQAGAFGGGTGTGLAVCRKIVARHGGHIWVESPGLDRGSTFYFTLPAAIPESPC